MVADIHAWHMFIQTASECEPGVRTLLAKMDDDMRRQENEPLYLEKDGELVDALCRAVAATKIQDVSGHVRNAIRRHNILEYLQILIEYATILSGGILEKSDTLNKIEELHKVLAVIDESEANASEILRRKSSISF